MNDEEFREIMCDHMRQQTAFLATIRDIAQTYQNNWKAVQNVYWFVKWIVALAAGWFGLSEGLKAMFPHK